MNRVDQYIIDALVVASQELTCLHVVNELYREEHGLPSKPSLELNQINEALRLATEANTSPNEHTPMVQPLGTPAHVSRF